MKMLANLKVSVFAAASIIAFYLTGTHTALAVVQFEQEITPNILLGSDNTNGSFTTDRRNGIEIGLRAKLRFNDDNLAENTFNSKSNGTYRFAAGTAPSGFPFDPAPNNTPVWNFEWSVNTNYDESSGLPLNGLTYEMGLDFDPGPRTQFLVLDPITLSHPPSLTPPNHVFGDNYTANGDGIKAKDNLAYRNLLTSKNVVQNSWNYEFFDDPPFDSFDPAVDGNYSIYFLVRNAEEQVVARADIQVLVGDAEPVVPADHFQCYDVTVSSKLDSFPEIGLSDQFGLRDRVHLSNKIQSYCTPADNNGGGVINPDNTLSCYSVKETLLRQEVTLTNQFGEHTILLTRPELLCVPSMQSQSINLEEDS